MHIFINSWLPASVRFGTLAHALVSWIRKSAMMHFAEVHRAPTKCTYFDRMRSVRANLEGKYDCTASECVCRKEKSTAAAYWLRVTRSTFIVWLAICGVYPAGCESARIYKRWAPAPRAVNMAAPCYLVCKHSPVASHPWLPASWWQTTNFGTPSARTPRSNFHAILNFSGPWIRHYAILWRFCYWQMTNIFVV